MDAGQIRNTFLNFFKEKDHTIVASAPMVIKDDPTLMFTNAGMNQFKDVFLGTASRKEKRIVDTQKCLRVSGKHNDLDQVGVDTYHHTMFEMLGNWSFGDYFKEEAIAWAWELLVDVYKLDGDRLYVTVFGGDEKDGLSADTESEGFWKNHIAEGRIIRCDKKDNFWEMGETGPCGPCSEIHIDLRTDDERSKVNGRSLVNKDDPEVIEIWNLVFIEFNRRTGGGLEALPDKHVDTGMGFERLCMALQNKTSNYDTDVFSPLIDELAKISGKKYGESEDVNIALRVIADHLRAIAFAISDGQLPYRDGAGYVIRRILRRAVRYAYSFLDYKEPIICQLVPTLVEQMQDQFPELNSQRDIIENVIRDEEASFLRTLELGMKKLASVSGELSGAHAFELYDTFGFPIDLTQLISREKGFTIDMKGFEEEMQEQRTRARSASAIETDDWVVVHECDMEKFIGYEEVEAEVLITKYRKVKLKGKSFYQICMDPTPFYPEGGGQVGDTGVIVNDGEETKIIDTKKENNQILHFTEELPVDPSASFHARIDAEKRRLTENNHSATHLMHSALRSVLGTHVEQKGSLVNADYLRFDFSHFSKIELGEISKIEEMVNAKIKENIPLETREMPIDEAKALGAMALFGEKYGDVVRVVIFDEKYSVELCGGTHVKSTDVIELFKIITETSVASGIRRIEALTAGAAKDRGGAQENKVKLFIESIDKVKALHGESNSADGDIAQLEAIVSSVLELKIPEQIKAKKELLAAVDDPKTIEQGIATFTETTQAINKKLMTAKKQQVSGLKDTLKGKIQDGNGFSYLIEQVNLDGGSMKDLAFQLKAEVDNLFLVFGGESNGKALLTVVVAENLIADKGLDAGAIVKEIAKEIQGGGGGQPFFATAGGKNVDGIAAALEKAKRYIQ
ncbi:alanine--tRNA ligase [Flavobacteriales bacterium AH-315-E23]|nr:alanine--tRNA ligase [Flavobacteriales bacterium AH-315-E23]